MRHISIAVMTFLVGCNGILGIGKPGGVEGDAGADLPDASGGSYDASGESYDAEPDAEPTADCFDASPGSGLVSWWRAEGDGTDDGPAQNDGANVGATFTTGRFGQAFLFAGSAYVDAPTAGLPIGSAERTLEMWVRLDEIDTEEAFFGGYGGFGSSTASYHTGASMSGSTAFFSSWGPAIGGPSLTLGQWHHIAATNIGTAATLYVDGVVAASGSMDFSTPSDSRLYIGRIPGALGDMRRLIGAVNEVAVFDGALTDDDIELIAAEGKCSPQ